MKKIILLILTLGLILDARATNWTNYPFATPGASDTFLFAVLTTNQFGAPTNAQISAPDLVNWIKTNSPVAAVANPLVSGVNYTSPAASGWLTVNFVFTNAATATLTNLTTGSAQRVGAVNAIGTNYDSVLMKLAATNVVVFTNTTSGVGILSSQWQP